VSRTSQLLGGLRGPRGGCAIVRHTNDEPSDASWRSEWAIRAEGVTKTYGEGEVAVRALRGVDLEIRRGELVVILGPSGSGKTTLLNVMGAIERPTAGRLLVPDYDLGRLDARGSAEYRRRRIGFVFQFFNLIASLTALENVQLIAELSGARDSASSEVALRAVGLSDRMDRFPGQLSGGEQQRVAIARAIV
jgi:putative ABC transport system ATP-binding protein